MTLTNWQKVKREFNRGVRKLDSWAQARWRTFIAPVKTWSWDLFKDKIIQVTHGDEAVAEKIAIFVIFQPEGLSKSTLRTLEYLSDSGFSTLVVVNHPLSVDDLEAVKRDSWRVLVRKNLGYDFGAYRDGVWYLRREGIVPELLLFLNDTIWMPASPHGDTLKKFCAQEGNYLTLFDFEYRPNGVADEIDRTNHKLAGGWFAVSFLFAVRRDVFVSSDFVEFWQNYVLYPDKFNAVSKGEVGFCHAMRVANFEPSYLLSKGELATWLGALGKSDIEVIFQELPTMNSRLWPQYNELASKYSNSEVGVEALRDFLLYLLQNINTIDFLAYIGLKYHGVNLIKKTNMKHFQNSGRFLGLLERGEVEVYPEVWSELRAFESRKLLYSASPKR